MPNAKKKVSRIGDAVRLVPASYRTQVERFLAGESTEEIGQGKNYKVEKEKLDRGFREMAKHIAASY